MKTISMPLRLDKDLGKMLREGARRTPHKKQELIRLTLRRHLREVIQQESLVHSAQRITNIDPWPAAAIKAAYRRIGNE